MEAWTFCLYFPSRFNSSQTSQQWLFTASCFSLHHAFTSNAKCKQYNCDRNSASLLAIKLGSPSLYDKWSPSNAVLAIERTLSHIRGRDHANWGCDAHARHIVSKKYTNSESHLGKAATRVSRWFCVLLLIFILCDKTVSSKAAMARII